MAKILFLLLILPSYSFAVSVSSANVTELNLTTHTAGILALIIFTIAYIFVIIEEYTYFRKSKPMLLAAGIIWMIIASVYVSAEIPKVVNIALERNFLEYSELFLFLLVAMTYIEVMRSRKVFEVLKEYLLSKGLSLRQLFWATGFLAFFMSPIADNLTTSLVMGAVVLAIGAGNVKFISLAFVNIVVAANAGGAFSPFGDITTLMVWQANVLDFLDFFDLFIPSLVNFLVPATIMHFFIENKKDGKDVLEIQKTHIKKGGLITAVLFILTIATAVSFHNFFHLPPTMGMMMGLSYLLIAGYFIRRHDKEFEIFHEIARVEWDTLLFFFGVILSVGGLGFMGYLALVSEFFYIDLGATNANILVGILSAIVDNIPVMFAVLTMNPDMSHGQWLLVTLTAGVGGSLLSVGSAAGVALMGQSRGLYTFMSHLKWTPVIALGYALSIVTHLYLNEKLFSVPIS